MLQGIIDSFCRDIETDKLVPRKVDYCGYYGSKKCSGICSYARERKENARLGDKESGLESVTE
ncbi:MAG: hypothetical protein KKE50_07160 [Nanoarchaeota archaeon]|nr:hypothetical protein [Nanoarchaeota archaeon]